MDRQRPVSCSSKTNLPISPLAGGDAANVQDAMQQPAISARIANNGWMRCLRATLSGMLTFNITRCITWNLQV